MMKKTILLLILILGLSSLLKREFYIDSIDDFDIPSYPAYGSKRFTHDEEVYSRIYSMKGSSRWMIAIDDASYRQFDKRVSEVLGIQITKNTTPSIYRLLRIIQKSSLRVVDKYKEKYKRTRPYVYYDSEDCVSNRNKKMPHGHILLDMQHFHGPRL